MVAPEGSEEKKEARAALVMSARACRRHMTPAAWLEKMVVLAPALVAIVGYDDLEKIAEYTWRGPNW